MNFFTADIELKVDPEKIKGQLAKARSLVTRTVDKIEKSFKRMSAAFKSAFDKMVRVAKVGALALVGAFVLVTRAAMKQEDVEKRLAITLKATGHAAGLSAQQLIKQAAAIQKVTRFGDESVIALQTMLLTFKSIKGDIFQRATEATLDMAVGMAAVSGRTVDLSASSIQLGKALNDPLVGMTALSRVGVKFTDQQKKMVEQFMLTNQIAKAQDLILTELEGQFGGMARDVDTASGALRQMWNALGDVAEAIGRPFLSSIKETAREISQWAVDNEKKIGIMSSKVVAHIGFIKDILMDLIAFAKTDFSAGWEVVWKLFVQMIELGGRLAMDAAFRTGRGIWKAAKKGIGGPTGKELTAAEKEFETLYGRAPKVTHALLGFKGWQRWYDEADQALMDNLISQKRLQETSESTFKGFSDTAAQTFKAYKEKALGTLEESNVDIEASHQKLIDRLKEIDAEFVAGKDVTGKEQDTIVGAGGLQDVEDRQKETSINVANYWRQAGNRIQYGMADVFMDLGNRAITFEQGLISVFDGIQQSFMQMASDMLAEWIRVQTEMLIRQQMTGGAGAGGAGGFGALLGGLFGGGGPQVMAAGTAQATTGMGLEQIGQTFITGHRGIPADYMPRLHNGLKPDEFGAILQKGEEVIPKNNAGQKQTININVSAIDGPGTFDFISQNSDLLATAIEAEMNVNHPFRRKR